MSSAVVVASIVEGHGEVEALPLLLRRLTEVIAPGRMLDVRRPIRVNRGTMLKEGELERYVQLASGTVAPAGAVLVVIDADDDCPATLGPSLQARAKVVAPGLTVGVVVANREFEAWFLSAADSLRAKRGLRPDLQAPGDPETIRDAKGWLQERRTDGRAYSPTVDQPALVSGMDLHQAKAGSPSFAKLWREVERILAMPLRADTPETRS